MNTEVLLEILEHLRDMASIGPSGEEELDLPMFLKKIDQEIEFLYQQRAYFLLGMFSLLRDDLTGVRE